ncbi:SIMPL domain-containing protein [Woodsholea maritima]|uniref:SIMPL domain-containing protein n=1 Tax=Woodsholea maritima TaxID=240237 RepID=UPI00037DE430|nr:SIMPL domain-containing protein [Woodsholea maritima]
MLRTALLSCVLALPVLNATPSFAQGVQIVDQQPSLTLNVAGEVRAAPDMASVSAGVVTRGESAAEALAENARVMNEVFAQLNRSGIAERDRQTTNLSVQPVYENRPYNANEEERAPRIVAYEARNTVTAIVRDLDKVGRTIDALVNSGANQLQGVEFGLQDQSMIEDQARRQAMTKLRERANLYGEAGGFEIGRILTLSESGSYRPSPVMYARAEMAFNDGAAPSPVAGGELVVSVNVNASFAIIED